MPNYGGHFFQDLAEGITFAGLGAFFMWEGFKKAMGKKSREWIFLGVGFTVFGLLALFGLL